MSVVLELKYSTFYRKTFINIYSAPHSHTNAGYRRDLLQEDKFYNLNPFQRVRSETKAVSHLISERHNIRPYSPA